MEITIIRSGGIAGLTEELGPINTETLPTATAAQVGDIIAKLDFFTLPADIAKKAVADMFDYTTTVADDGRRHSVHWNNSSPDADKSQLDALLRLLEGFGTFGPTG